MKKILLLFSIIFFSNLSTSIVLSKDKLYEKIDLFGEVLENIKKEYVDEIDQSEIMDSAINGVFSHLILIQLIWDLNF